MKPNNFSLASDYASLKNDSQGNTISVTIPSGTTWNISSPTIATATLAVGTINAGLRARGNSSKYPKWMNGLSLYSDLSYTIPSITSAGTQTIRLYCTLERINATTIRLTAATEGGSGAPDYQTAESQTITFVFSTFLSPFD